MHAILQWGVCSHIRLYSTFLELGMGLYFSFYYPRAQVTFGPPCALVAWVKHEPMYDRLWRSFENNTWERLITTLLLKLSVGVFLLWVFGLFFFLRFVVVSRRFLLRLPFVFLLPLGTALLGRQVWRLPVQLCSWRWVQGFSLGLE